MTATPIAAPAAPPTTTQARRPRRPCPWVFHTVRAPVTLLWVLPLVFVTDLRFPINAALLNRQGGYATSWNVVPAGALIAAVPTTIVFFALLRRFVSGLLVGANK